MDLPILRMVNVHHFYPRFEMWLNSIGPIYSPSAQDHNLQVYTRLVLTRGFTPRVAKLDDDSATNYGPFFY